jgi:hypothetical protein
MINYSNKQKNINDAYISTADLLTSLYPEGVPIARLRVLMSDAKDYLTQEEIDIAENMTKEKYNII